MKARPVFVSVDFRDVLLAALAGCAVVTDSLRITAEDVADEAINIADAVMAKLAARDAAAEKDGAA